MSRNYSEQLERDDEGRRDDGSGAPGSSSSGSIPSAPSTPVMEATGTLDDFQREFWAYHMNFVESAPLASSSTSNPARAAGSSKSSSQSLSTAPNPNSKSFNRDTEQSEQVGSSTGGGSRRVEGNDGNDKDWEEVEVKGKQKEEKKGKKWKGKTLNFKPGPGQLPLARIKKVMKLDEEVEMISAEAPLIFAKASELFIADLTARGFVEASVSKRRTIQRSDIAAAIGKSDLFDFLVDVIPREETQEAKKRALGGVSSRKGKSKTGGKGKGKEKEFEDEGEDQEGTQAERQVRNRHEVGNQTWDGNHDEQSEVGRFLPHSPNSSPPPEENHYPAMHIPSH